MKITAFIFSIVLTMSAYAASTSTLKCSNAEGTVKWEENSVTKTIQFAGKETFSADLRLVEIKFLEKVSLEHNNINMCGYYRDTEVFAGKVEIQAVPHSSLDLRRFSAADVVETFVICRKELKTTFVCNK